MAEPKFLYGSHYSTPGYILYYLARVGKCKVCEQLEKGENLDKLTHSKRRRGREGGKRGVEDEEGCEGGGWE